MYERKTKNKKEIKKEKEPQKSKSKMSLNVVKKGVLGKDKFFYQAIELLLQPEDRDAGDESEAKLREMLKENLQAQHKHKASAGPGRPATAAASRPGTDSSRNP